ncbi:hypothetical protein LTS08_000216 [Lithohypha guttulata]|nr:hypothetical protein LTS08_000216 [Lithohypha guttulata]
MEIDDVEMENKATAIPVEVEMLPAAESVEEVCRPNPASVQASGQQLEMPTQRMTPTEDHAISQTNIAYDALPFLRGAGSLPTDAQTLLSCILGATDHLFTQQNAATNNKMSDMANWLSTMGQGLAQYIQGFAKELAPELAGLKDELTTCEEELIAIRAEDERQSNVTSDISEAVENIKAVSSMKSDVNRCLEDIKTLAQAQANITEKIAKQIKQSENRIVAEIQRQRRLNPNWPHLALSEKVVDIHVAIFENLAGEQALWRPAATLALTGYSARYVDKVLDMIGMFHREARALLNTYPDSDGFQLFEIAIHGHAPKPITSRRIWFDWVGGNLDHGNRREHEVAFSFVLRLNHGETSEKKKRKLDESVQSGSSVRRTLFDAELFPAV